MKRCSLLKKLSVLFLVLFVAISPAFSLGWSAFFQKGNESLAEDAKITELEGKSVTQESNAKIATTSQEQKSEFKTVEMPLRDLEKLSTNIDILENNLNLQEVDNDESHEEFVEYDKEYDKVCRELNRFHLLFGAGCSYSFSNFGISFDAGFRVKDFQFIGSISYPIFDNMFQSFDVTKLGYKVSFLYEL